MALTKIIIYYLLLPKSANAAGLFGWLLGPAPATASDLIVFVAIVKNIATGAVGAIAVSMFFWGIFKLFVSGGDQNKVSEARKIIIASLVGLSIIITAGFIVNTFINITS